MTYTRLPAPFTAGVEYTAEVVKPCDQDTVPFDPTNAYNFLSGLPAIAYTVPSGPTAGEPVHNPLELALHDCDPFDLYSAYNVDEPATYNRLRP